MKSTHTAAYSTFIRRLIAEREAVGCTQAELGKRLRKPQSYVSKVETLERRLDIVEYLYWAKALEFDPERLLKNLIDGVGR